MKMLATLEEFKQVFSEAISFERRAYHWLAIMPGNLYFYYNWETGTNLFDEGLCNMYLSNDLLCKGYEDPSHLERNFTNPIFPTTEECVLWELEMGYPYIIKPKED